MERIRRALSLLPSWMLSGMTLAAILWLTLAPKPLGDNSPKLFPGADKIVHGIMFGGFAAMLILDWQRKNYWKPVSWLRVLAAATMSASLGILIEYAQAYMRLGRSFENADIIADTSGAFIVVLLWMIFQNYWLPQR